MIMFAPVLWGTLDRNKKASTAMPSERIFEKPSISRWATVTYVQKSWLAGSTGI